MSVRSGRSSIADLARASHARRSQLGLKANLAPGHVRLALSRLHSSDQNSYNGVVCALRDCTLSDTELVPILKECYSSVGLLGRQASLLVEVLFTLDWPCMSKELVNAFSEWTLSLTTAQIYHVPLVAKCLMKYFTKNDAQWVDEPTKEQKEIFSHIHNLIAQIIETIPLSKDILMQSAIENYPYYKQSIAIHQSYVYNLLWMTRYLPDLSDQILTLILNRLILIDVNIGNKTDESVFEMENEMEDNVKELRECLDLCMKEVLQWMDAIGPTAFDLLMPIFHNVIVPTHGTTNVQFVTFYCLSRDVNRTPEVLESLWKLILSAQIGPGLRQASVAHLSGMLARAKFISFKIVKQYIQKMADWCHSYIKAQEGIFSNNGKNPHSVFYSVCQALFYLIVFKQRKLFKNKENIAFIESLTLPRIIMSSINPLRACNMGIVDAFASITRIHQIVYCHTVIEHNTRHYLRLENDINTDWFPYDPCTLPMTYNWIEPIYEEFEEHFAEKSDHGMDVGEEDDFLMNSPSFNFLSKSFNSQRSVGSFA